MKNRSLVTEVLEAEKHHHDQVILHEERYENEKKHYRESFSQKQREQETIQLNRLKTEKDRINVFFEEKMDSLQIQLSEKSIEVNQKMVERLAEKLIRKVYHFND